MGWDNEESLDERNDARSWARRLYRRVQELETEAGELFDTGLGLSVQYNEDVDALVAALGHIICHNRLRRGWLLPGLSASLRERVEAAAKAEWDSFVARRG